MTEGIITTSPKEVPIVADIFSMYLQGKSLKEIACQLNAESVTYGNGSPWNLNMIKRILENEVYLGNDTYPQLVAESTFEMANARKVSKRTNVYNLDENILAIKKILYCKECGGRMSRIVATGYWTCKNTDCFRYDYNLTDQMIIGAVINVINIVIANPALIQCSGIISEYSPSAIISRHQKELQQKLDTPNIDYDRLKDEIIAFASEKSNGCTYNDNIEATERIVMKLKELG